MKGNSLFAGALGMFLLMGALDCHAAKWVKIDFDIPNKNVDSIYYNGDTVKGKAKTLSWTEKFVLTDFGAKKYTKHLSEFPACQESIAKHGNATYHQLDFQIKDGKFRVVAKRNYTKDDKLLCTDKDMGHELETSWHPIEPKSPMMERYYLLRTKYKLGDI